MRTVYLKQKLKQKRSSTGLFGNERYSRAIIALSFYPLLAYNSEYFMSIAYAQKLEKCITFVDLLTNMCIF